jgi:RNA polymerase sigma-70 factor (ECF subfamily)
MELNLTADMAGWQEPREEALRCFDQWHDPLRRYLICAGSRAEDADDAVQETFLRLYQHLAKDGDRSNLCGWIFQVARNYVRDQR